MYEKTALSKVEDLIGDAAWEMFETKFKPFRISCDLPDKQLEVAEDTIEDIVSEMIGHACDAVCIEFEEVINRRIHELTPYLADDDSSK